jgi:hypothetical protein
MNNSNQRRYFIKSSAFGLIGITAFGNLAAKDGVKIEKLKMLILFFTGIPA